MKRYALAYIISLRSLTTHYSPPHSGLRNPIPCNRNLAALVIAYKIDIRLVVECHVHSFPGRIIDQAPLMAAAGGIHGNEDFARVNDKRGTVVTTEFQRAGKRNHVLCGGRGMPVVRAMGRCFLETDTRSCMQQVVRHGACDYMRMAICAGVNFICFNHGAGIELSKDTVGSRKKLRGQAVSCQLSGKNGKPAASRKLRATSCQLSAVRKRKQLRAASYEQKTNWQPVTGNWQLVTPCNMTPATCNTNQQPATNNQQLTTFSSRELRAMSKKQKQVTGNR